MDTEEAVDYSEDPHPKQVIFRNPNFISFEAGPSRLLISPPHSSPVVTLVEHRSLHLAAESSPQEPPSLDLSPLSPGNLRFLSTVIPPSPSFDPHPHNTTFFVVTSQVLQIHLSQAPLSLYTHPLDVLRPLLSGSDL